MRIPQYEQQVNTPNAPQFSQIADVRNDNLSVIADGLNEVYKVKLKEQEEAQKTAFFQADTSIQMALDKAKFDIAERIKNGGSYTNAEAEYQKAHDAAIAEFSSAFDADKSGNTKLRAMAEYQSRGLDNLMSLRDMVTARRKSDTAASANLRAEQLSQQMLDATPEQAENIKKQIASLYASATAATGGSPDEGRLKAMKAIQGAEQNRYQLFMQNNAENPQAQLDEIERLHNEKLVDTDFYIQARGNAMHGIAVLGSVDKVNKYISDPVSTKRPTQQDVDLTFQKYAQDNQQLISSNPAQYENDVISLSLQTGSMPTPIKNQAASYLGTYRQDMSQSDAATTAQSARIVSAISNNGLMMNKENGGFDKETIAKADLINRRVEAGMNEYDAVSSVMSMYDDETARKAYQSGRTKILSEIASGKTELPITDNQDARARYIDLVSEQTSIGASLDEAKDTAKDKLENEFGEFNGVTVRNPPQKVPINGVFYNEDYFINAAKVAYDNITTAPLPDNARLIVQGDRETQRMVMAGENPSFPVTIHVDGNRPIPFFGKDGQPVRIKFDPIKAKSQKKTNMIKLSGLGISG